ncbi:MAG: hypothetical protein BWY11_00897 [Firmicutes bacterium ADurb.Bin182]|nr:MAG: hypothetical protein BWY11_00897 [Firmicutes bacterium ADurb.Bin182]
MGLFTGALLPFGSELSVAGKIAYNAVATAFSSGFSQFSAYGKIDVKKTLQAGATAALFTAVFEAGSYLFRAFRANAVDLADESGYIEFGGKSGVSGNEGAGNYLEGGKGFNTFSDVKKALGPAGDGKAWHHIVEKNQISRSVFSATDVHNTRNLVSVESGFSGSIHNKLSGHYSSIQPYTNGQIVRQWLSNLSFQQQFEYGLNQLHQYGTMASTNTGWVFTPFK